MNGKSCLSLMCVIGFIVSAPIYHYRNKPIVENRIKAQIEKNERTNKEVSEAVPTIRTVILIAESAFKADNATVDQSSLIVNLENNIWTVVRSPKNGEKGGVSQIQIDKITGKILNISHGE